MVELRRREDLWILIISLRWSLERVFGYQHRALPCAIYYAPLELEDCKSVARDDW